MRSTVLLTCAAALVMAGAASASAQELPMGPVRGANQAVWPAYEGWYDNQDGTYVMYFGYMNRNSDEVVEIPRGENNFIEPAEFDGAQPTTFQPRRHWGVFGIVVPADFPVDRKIYWNVVVDGKTHRVPGHLQPEWKTDAIGGGASGDTPPVLTMGTAQGRGPLGVTAPQSVTAKVGTPVRLAVSATDKPGTGPDLAALAGFPSPGAGQVTLTWGKYSGPGEVEFAPATGPVPASGGEMTTMATFSEPGEYVVRVLANDTAMVTAGDAQCCWTNGYVKVMVTR